MKRITVYGSDAPVVEAGPECFLPIGVPVQTSSVLIRAWRDNADIEWVRREQSLKGVIVGHRTVQSGHRHYECHKKGHPRFDCWNPPIPE